MKAMNSPAVFATISGACLVALGSPEASASIWSLVLIAILLKWFWWSETPAVIPFLFFLPFIEIHTTVLQSFQENIALNAIYPNGGKTFWLASLGLFFCAAAFKLSTRSINWSKLSTKPVLTRAADDLSQKKVVLSVGIALAFSTVIDRAIPYGSSVEQLQYFTAGITSTCIFCFFLLYMLTGRGHTIFWCMFLVYLGTSFYSFFSSWRTPFFLLLITSMSRYKEIKTTQILGATPIIAPMFLLIFLWQTVKGEYREFLSGGHQSQQIRVSQSEALSKFGELTLSAIESNSLFEEAVVDATYKRAGYLEYFSAAVTKVPKDIPYETGKLLNQSLNFSLVPRIINPNKGIKNDRAKVEKYTDFYFGVNSFSSFSLGHYCEAYIDWGPYGMMIHLFIYGLLGGLLFRITIKRYNNLNTLLLWGIIWVVMYPFGTFQQDMVTVLGRVVWGAVCHLFLFSPIYYRLDKFIRS